MGRVKARLAHESSQNACLETNMLFILVLNEFHFEKQNEMRTQAIVRH